MFVFVMLYHQKHFQCNAVEKLIQFFPAKMKGKVTQGNLTSFIAFSSSC